MKKPLLTLMCLAAMMSAGMGLRAQEITITLSPYWNWISYPNAVPMELNEALGDFVPAEGDIIKSRDAFVVYQNGVWSGVLTHFMPGKGYMYRSARTETVSFVFAQPSSSVVATATPTDVTVTSAVAGGLVMLPEGSHVFLRGVCWGTTPSPDIDGSHTTDGTGIGSFTTILEGLDPNTTYYVRAYVVSDYGLAYGNEVSFITVPIWTIEVTPNPTEGGTITGAGDYEQNAICNLTAIANEGYVFANWTENDEVVSTDATYTFTVDASRTLVANFDLDHTYVDLGLPSGLLWATCNVGAETPEDYGDYFAWGETQPKTVYNWSTYQYCNGSENTLTKYCFDSNYGSNGYTDNLTYLQIEDDAASANWGAGWRIPTKNEWEELCQYTTSIWTTQNGVNGRLFTASNGNSIFLPVTGFYRGSEINEISDYGGYSSISLAINWLTSCAEYFEFGPDRQYTSNGWYYYHREIGRPVRAVRYPENHSFNINASPNQIEYGSVNGIGMYEMEQTCTLAAVPNEGYTFLKWKEDGAMVSTENPYSFAVRYDRNLEATFYENSTYPLTYSYNENNHTAIVTGRVEGVELEGELIIPETVVHNGEIYTVTTIAGRAFDGCIGLTSIVFPNSLVSIGSYAFEHCSGLTEITIPSSVTSIGGINPFGLCPNLAQITVESGNAYYDSRDNCNAIIETSTNCLISGSSSTYIPNSVTSLGQDAFYGITILSLTVLAETPPIVGVYALTGVDRGIPVYIPCGSLEAYQNAEGWNEFTNIVGICPGTITVTASPAEYGTVTGGGSYEGGETCTVTATPNEGYFFTYWSENGRSVSNESTYSFMVTGDRNLVANFVVDGNIVFADANVKAICVEHWDTNGDGELSYVEVAAVTTLDNAFYNHQEIITFDELQYFTGLTFLGGDLNNCRNLQSVVLPSTLTRLSGDALGGCHLFSITIPQSVTTIEGGMCPWTSSLEQIIVEEGNPVYDSRENCNAIVETSSNKIISGCKNTTYPTSVTAIAGAAFFGNRSGTTVAIPSHIISIEGNPFVACSVLEQLTVESGNPMYDSRDNCNAIIETSTNALIGGCKNTVIPNTVTRIHGVAFHQVYALTSIVIPSSVITIDNGAFHYTGLSSVTIEFNDPPAWNVSAIFENWNMIVNVPCGSLEAYQNAEGWSEFTNFVEMCDEVPTGAINGKFTINADGDKFISPKATCNIRLPLTHGSLLRTSGIM